MSSSSNNTSSISYSNSKNVKEEEEIKGADHQQVEKPAFEIKSEGIKNLGRLRRASAFSIFKDLHLQEPTNKKTIRSDYKVYDLNNRVIFYVSSTTSIPITKDGPFCLKIGNKDQKQVAKFMRNEPRAPAKKFGFLSVTGCCSTKRDEMEISDDIGNLIAKSTVYNDLFRNTEIVIRDPEGKDIIRVKGSRDTKDVFYVFGQKDKFYGEIRQKIISSGNSVDNYKGVSAWFSPDLSIDIKLLFLAAAFLIEIDYFSDAASRKTPFHQPVTDYLVPIIQSPPYHQKVGKTKLVKVKKRKTKNENSVVGSTVVDSKTEKERMLIMPEIHHIKNFAPIGGDVDTSTNSKLDKTEVDAKPVENELEMNGMSREQFGRAGRKILDYLVKQDEGLKMSRCTPAVKPGYLKAMIPPKPPAKPEDVDDILEDYNKLILPGLSHSGHPNFLSFFPVGNAFHCTLAALLSAHIGDSGFSWMSNPAMTELEVLMMDWLGEMMGMPKEFSIFAEGSRGGGCMQHSVSESNFLVMVAARSEKLNRVKKHLGIENTADILSRMVVYTSDQAHSSIENSAASTMVKVRVLQSDDHYSLRGDTLYNAIITDKKKGLIPFFVAATFGTTGPCSFDSLHELGPICRENDLWLHVDAAYAGSGLICPELRSLMPGIEWADSFSTSPSKLAIPVCDVTCLWVRDRAKLQVACIHVQSELPYKGLPSSRRFGALKMWFIIRTFGVENLQKQVREHIRLGQYMEAKLRSDSQFEICNRVQLGLVCFRAKGEDNFNKALLFRLNESGRISLSSCTLDGKFTIRLCINTPKSNEEDLDLAFDLISSEAAGLKPFRDQIDLMTPEDLEDFLRHQKPKEKKDKGKEKKLKVAHPAAALQSTDSMMNTRSILNSSGVKGELSESTLNPTSPVPTKSPATPIKSPTS